MRGDSLKKAFLRVLLIAYVSLYSVNLVADPCNSIGSGPEEFTLQDGTRIKTLGSVERQECQALTDRTKNNGQPLTIQQLEIVRADLLRPHKADTLLGSMMRSSVNRKVDCMIASADISICMCLSETLPVHLSYLEYLGLLYPSNSIRAQDLGINEAELRKLTGVAWAARDRCVGKTPAQTE